MTIRDICPVIDATLICGSDSHSFEGVYVGDLLSRAMSHVQYQSLWITIMSNVNVIAVATLTEPAAVILAEGVVLQEEALASARENNITVLSTQLSAYELCVRLHTAMAEPAS